MIPFNMKYFKANLRQKEWWLPGTVGRGEWELQLIGIEFQFHKMKRVVMDVDGSDS